MLLKLFGIISMLFTIKNDTEEVKNRILYSLFNFLLVRGK